MLKNFIKNEDGVETVEFIGMIAVAAVLIIAAKNVADGMQKTASSKVKALDSQLDNMLANTGG